MIRLMILISLIVPIQIVIAQDSDGDGILDNDDNCPTVYNQFQLDYNENGVGDNCEDLTCEELGEIVPNINTSLSDLNNCVVDSDCVLVYFLVSYSWYEDHGYVHYCCDVDALNIDAAPELGSICGFENCATEFNSCDMVCPEPYSAYCNEYGNCSVEYSYLDDCGEYVLPENFNQSMDCAGVCYGDSIIDDCGDCVTPNQFNSAMDCDEVCYGDAFINDCEVCVGGTTGLEEDTCFGCTDPYSCNYDPEATIDDGSCTCIGDANLDSSIDILDVVLIVEYILNLSELTEEQLYFADAFTDGSIDILDVVFIIEIILDSESL